MDSKKHFLSYLISLFIVVTIQIAGFTLLWNKMAVQQEYVYLPTGNNPGVNAGTQTTPVVAAIKLTDESMLREIIQSVLKQELASYARQLNTAPQSMQNIPNDLPDVKENSPTNIQALNESTNIVSGAIAQGKWTREDNVALMSHVHQLTRSQRYKIMDEIGQAINRQELKIEDAPPAL